MLREVSADARVSLPPFGTRFPAEQASLQTLLTREIFRACLRHIVAAGWVSAGPLRVGGVDFHTGSWARDHHLDQREATRSWPCVRTDRTRKHIRRRGSGRFSPVVLLAALLLAGLSLGMMFSQPVLGFAGGVADPSIRCRVSAGAIGSCTYWRQAGWLGRAARAVRVGASDPTGHDNAERASRRFTASAVGSQPRSAPGYAFGVTAVDPVAQTIRAAADARYLGATVVRVEVLPTASVAEIRPIKQAFDAQGIEIILLASRKPQVDGDPRPDAGPLSEQAANLAAWANAFGPAGVESGGYPVRQIEFGNENGFDYAPKIGHGGGATYANNYRAAYDAINGPNGNASVGLLAQADASYGWTGTWVAGMFEGEPTLAAMVADNGGWVVHPYGPLWKQKLDQVVDATAIHGAASSIPIFVTEWGLASTRDGRCLTGNYGWYPCMDYEEAAATLRSSVQAMRADERFGNRIVRLMLYQQHDKRGEPGDGPHPVVTSEREDYFGALKTWYYGLASDARLGQRDKGAYTAEVRRQTGAGTTAMPPTPVSPGARNKPLPAVPGCPSSTDNVIRGGPGNDRKKGTAKGDRILVGNGNDFVEAGAGEDCVDLGPGADRATGGTGDDLIFGRRGTDRVSGGSGRDTLFGGSGNDRLRGGDGNDDISGGRGVDRISGGAGRDTISGGTGRDVISGGSGNDRIDARDGTRDRIGCGSGRDTVIADRVDVVRDCERVRRTR